MKSYQVHRLQNRPVNKNPEGTLIRGGFPELHLPLDIEDLEESEGQRCRDYWDYIQSKVPFDSDIRERKRGLVMFGKKGYGKSAAAAAIAKEFARHGAEVSFIDCLILNELAKTRDQLLIRARQTWLTVIDDLGAQENEYFGVTRDNIESLIRARYNANLPTIITTNITEMKTKFPDVFSIFVECYTSIHFKSKNWRESYRGSPF